MLKLLDTIVHGDQIGMSDPDTNPTLRSLVEKAKRENVARHVI